MLSLQNWSSVQEQLMFAFSLKLKKGFKKCKSCIPFPVTEIQFYFRITYPYFDTMKKIKIVEKGFKKQQKHNTNSVATRIQKIILPPNVNTRKKTGCAVCGWVQSAPVSIM